MTNSAGDDVGKPGVVAEGRQIVILTRALGKRGLQFDGTPKVGEPLVNPSRSSFEAGGVVIEHTVRRVVGDKCLGTVGALLEGSGFEQRNQRRE